MVTKREPTIEIYQSHGQFRWRLLGGNGEIMLVGESHPSKGKVERAVRRGRELFPLARIVFVMDSPNGGRVGFRQAKIKKGGRGPDKMPRKRKSGQLNLPVVKT